MGHQINFFLTPADTSDLREVLGHAGELHILHSYSGQPTPRAVETMDLGDTAKRWLFYYLVQPALLEFVITKFVPMQNYWVIDDISSPVVEFSACYFSNEILREGRMFYTDGFYDDENRWQEKPSEFRTWAKSIFGRTKRTLHRRGSFYIGSNAEKWRAAGNGRFVTSAGQVVA